MGKSAARVTKPAVIPPLRDGDRMTAGNVTRLGRNRRKAIEPTADGADKIEAAGFDLVASRVSGGTNVRQCRHPALTRRATRCTQPDSIFIDCNAAPADRINPSCLYPRPSRYPRLNWLIRTVRGSRFF